MEGERERRVKHTKNVTYNLAIHSQLLKDTSV